MGSRRVHRARCESRGITHDSPAEWQHVRWLARDGSCRFRANQKHNAHRSETVTVHYRWHPLFGSSLRVRRRVKSRNGEQVFCELPNDTICALPTWMFSADCTRFTLGRPLIRIEALRELREVLTAWQTTYSCDMASLRQSPLEVVHETSNEADRLSTVASTTRHRVQNSDIPRQAKRTRSRAGRTPHQRITRKQRKKDKRGRR